MNCKSAIQNPLPSASLDAEGNGFNEIFRKPTPSLYRGEGWDLEVYPITRKGIADHFGCDEDDVDVDRILSEARPCVVI